MRILASPAFSNEKVNPYNSLLYREINLITPAVEEYSHKKALLENYDIIHFHWPDGYINQPGLVKSLQRISLFVIIVLIAKARGAKIVWTVHNIVPHDCYREDLSRRFMRWFIYRCDGFIFMSDANKTQFISRYRIKKNICSAIIPHGHYRSSYAPGIDQTKAKALLGLPADKKVLLSFGMIKYYKNIDRLIALFREANLTDYYLVVAGNPESAPLREKLTQLAAQHPDVHLFLRFIPDDEIHIYHSAADLVILPYKTILNSGALILALSFNKPVIAPLMGAVVTLQQELGNDWIYGYEGELRLSTFINAIQSVEQQSRPDLCPLTNYNWDRLAALTLAFYQSLI